MRNAGVVPGFFATRVPLRIASALLWLGCNDAVPPNLPSQPWANLVERSASNSESHVPPLTFPTGTQSLELERTVGVRLHAGDASVRIGTIAVDTRVHWTRTAAGSGCRGPWVEIAPRGWICSDYVTPSNKPPHGNEVPQLGRGEIVPGTYGKVTAARSFMVTADRSGNAMRLRAKAPVVGSLNVRKYDEVAIEGARYWKIAQNANQYVLASTVTEHVVSPYAGSRLGDDLGHQLPIAFVWPRPGAQRTPTTAAPYGNTTIRQLERRTLVPILETLAEPGAPTALRVGIDEWIAGSDARVFRAVAPPASLLPGEHWIDIDLDTQILVAFEGTLAVYATLVSTGGKETPTETGVFRIWLKESEADMNGLNGEDPYSVATVPWTQFFSPIKGLALHAAYWHDRFGRPLSHGCVNLAPRDARRLYYWSDPQVPPGWTSTQGVVEAPGSIVRVRSSADPNPEFKGYAKKVADFRAAASR